MKMNRGFTLAEMLVAMALMSMLLGTMAILFKVGVNNAAVSNAQFENVSAARIALQTVLGEVRQASSVDSPAAGASGATAAFTRPNPDGSTTPLHVRYSLVGSDLYRKTWVGPEPADDPSNESPVLGGLVSISFTTSAAAPTALSMTVTADCMAAGTATTPSAATLDGMAIMRAGR